MVISKMTSFSYPSGARIGADSGSTYWANGIPGSTEIGIDCVSSKADRL